MVTGRLIVEDQDGVFEFGTADKRGRDVTLTVRNPVLWTRLIMSSDIGGPSHIPPNISSVSLTVLLDYRGLTASEAYMEGDFDVSSLKDLLNVGVIHLLLNSIC